MPRNPRPILDRIEEQSEWDEGHRHQLWKGGLHRGNPAIKLGKRRVHPLRVLLNIEELTKRDRVLIFVHKLLELCNEPRCINPTHHHVQVKTDRYRDDYRPDWVDPRSAFTHHDLADIEYGLELLAEGKSFTHPDFEFISPHLHPEIQRRAK